MLRIPQIGEEIARAFSKEWKPNGVIILLDETHVKFATDLANYVLKNWVMQQMAAMEAQQPKSIEVVPA